MKRKLSVAVLCVFCAILMVLPSLGALQPGFDNFLKTASYKDGQFTDVQSSDWFSNDVKSVYEIGMMVGNSETTFNPSGNVTIAETATIAARLNKQYQTGSSIFENGSPWYLPYINYDLENGILNGDETSPLSKALNADTPASRAEFAAILSRALPEEGMSVRNSIGLESIPDVGLAILYHSEILKMYQAGILIGSDEYGSFLPESNIQRSAVAAIVNRLADPAQRKDFHPGNPASVKEPETLQPVVSEPSSSDLQTRFQLSNVPAYSGKAAVEVNGNVPFFSDSDLTVVSSIHLSELDSLGRCQVATACLGPETVAMEERGSIGMIKPSGWQTVRYDGIVDGNYLFNRCHLLMWKASSILDDNRNLITGTRYLNVEGMLPFEEELLDMIESTGFHVLYRVTPIFEGENLLASGVLMEAKSVEDFGNGLQFCVYAYNVQPQIGINYATGDSWLIEKQTEPEPIQDNPAVRQFVLNTSTNKFHDPDCFSVKKINQENRKDVMVNREDLISEGYLPCKNCNP